MLAEWAEQQAGCTVFREQVIPGASPEHAEARMDLVIYSPRVSGPIYVDFTVVTTLSAEAMARGAALRDGVASDIAAQRKQQRYSHCVT